MAGFAAGFAADLAADFSTGGVAAWVAVFAARPGAARVAEAACGRFRATGATAASDVLAAELAALASLTLPVSPVVGSIEPVPVAFFPPVVFAIAIPPLLETGLPGKKLQNC
jgi:hypothetical protein